MPPLGSSWLPARAGRRFRFVIDECIDARVAKPLKKRRHQAWTVPQAGLSSEDDDEVGVYADDKDAVLITDDRARSRFRRQAMFGQVIEIKGKKVLAVAHIQKHLPAIEAILEEHDEVVIAVNEAGAWITAPDHLKQEPPKVERRRRRAR